MKKLVPSCLVILISLFVIYQTTDAQYQTLSPSSNYSSERAPGRVLYVSPQGYLDTIRFRPIYKTMSEAFSVVRRGDTIKLYGKLREGGLTTPLNVTDVTIIGMGTKVRSGRTEAPVNNLMSGSADWTNSVNNKTNPILTIISAGWSIENIHFSNTTTNISTIRLDRNGSNRAANYTQIINSYFYGGLRGIEDNGGNAQVGVYNNTFYNSITGIESTSTSQALPLMWEIIGNRFVQNRNHIKMPLSNSIIRDNVLFRYGYESLNIVSIDLSAGGKNNSIFNNSLAHLFNQRGYVNTAYSSGTNDSWGPNYYSDKEGYGVPRE